MPAILVAFAAWIFELITGSVTWAGAATAWALSYVPYLAYLVVEEIIQALVTVIVGIPAPALYADISSQYGSVMGDLGGLASNLDIGTPLTMIFGAYTVRFLIRRIPFIG